MGRFLAGLLLLLSALFSGYGAVLGLAADVDSVLGGEPLPYIRRTLQPVLLVVLTASVAHAVAVLMAWGGGRRWRGWAWLGWAIAVLTVAAWSILLMVPATRASAYAGAGLVLAVAFAQIILALLALVLAPRSTRLAVAAGAAVVVALAGPAVPTRALAQSCPEGCVAVSGTPVTVTECFLFIFCDSYTLTPFDCMDATDTSAPCPADQTTAPPPAPEPDNEQQLVYVCPGNLGSGDPNATVVVYDFTCQIIYRIIDSLLREWG